MLFGIHPLIALGVLASTAATDAAYVFFNAAVSGRQRIRAANWSAIWYMLSAFAVISYTENAVYVLFAAAGSWLGAFASVTWLRRGHPNDEPVRHTRPDQGVTADQCSIMAQRIKRCFRRRGSSATGLTV